MHRTTMCTIPVKEWPHLDHWHLNYRSKKSAQTLPVFYFRRMSAGTSARFDSSTQKHSRLRCLVRVKGLVICFYLVWSGSILQFRQNIIKVGSKSWLLTCSSDIILSQPSYTGPFILQPVFYKSVEKWF